MKKRTATVVIAILAAALIGTGAYAYAESSGRARAERIGDIHGESALGELAMSLTDMEAAMRQSLYATEPALLASLCARAASNAAAALAGFGALPYSTQELERTAAHINGAGDYALWLSRRAAAGEGLDGERRAALAGLTETVSQLAGTCRRLLTELADGALEMDEYGAGADDGETDTVGYALRVLEAELPEFPELRYDGAYSAVAQRREAKALEGQEAVTEDEARARAAEYLSVPAARLAAGGRADCDLPCWSFTLTDEDGAERRVHLTEQGGRLLTLTDGCRPQTEALSQEEAAEQAEGFLRRLGYEGLIPAGAESDRGVAVLRYVAEQDDVACLPDEVSVAVSLEDGEVCGFDATGYILNHARRELPEPAVTAEQAQEALPETLACSAARLVVMQTEGLEELLCYELACTDEQGQGVAVYVGALDGKQQKISLAAGE